MARVEYDCAHARSLNIALLRVVSVVMSNNKLQPDAELT